MKPEAPSPPRTHVTLDAADLRLIELLTENGRLSNRSLATEVGLMEATVATRLRSLSRNHVLGVTATFDWCGPLRLGRVM